MQDTIECSTVLFASPEQIFHAWIDSATHSAMTGSPAQIDPRVGGCFSTWDGYISGVTLALEPFTRILQAWRTGEFPASSPDSRLELHLEELTPGETRLILKHSNIPPGQGPAYLQGWEEFYFQPMRQFFQRD